jgi:hypothetical protein
MLLADEVDGRLLGVEDRLLGVKTDDRLLEIRVDGMLLGFKTDDKLLGVKVDGRLLALEDLGYIFLSFVRSITCLLGDLVRSIIGALGLFKASFILSHLFCCPPLVDVSISCLTHDSFFEWEVNSLPRKSVDLQPRSSIMVGFSESSLVICSGDPTTTAIPSESLEPFTAATEVRVCDKFFVGITLPVCDTL